MKTAPASLSLSPSIQTPEYLAAKKAFREANELYQHTLKHGGVGEMTIALDLMEKASNALRKASPLAPLYGIGAAVTAYAAGRKAA